MHSGLSAIIHRMHVIKLCRLGLGPLAADQRQHRQPASGIQCRELVETGKRCRNEYRIRAAAGCGGLLQWSCRDRGRNRGGWILYKLFRIRLWRCGIHVPDAVPVAKLELSRICSISGFHISERYPDTGTGAGSGTGTTRTRSGAGRSKIQMVVL